MSVTTPVSAGTNTYSVSIKALKPSVSDEPVDPDATHPTTVKIFAMDSFGAESLVTEFDVVVNRPPVVGLDLLNVVLSRAATAATGEATLWAPSTPWSGVMYTLTDYFDDLDLSGIDGAVNVVGDTTCTFSTSPKQPTGRIGVSASTGPIVAEIKADLPTVAHLAAVNNGATVGRDWTTLVDTDTDAEVVVMMPPYLPAPLAP